MTTAPGTGRRRIVGASLVVGGVLTGAVLAGTISANAATSSTPSTPLTPLTPLTSSTATQAAPGVQENDGIPEAQEHHGGHGLGLSGTVTAVGSSNVTIKTATGSTITYTVNSSSDFDKNGEAQLSSLAAGDAVRYSVNSGTTTIDKLHAGNEAQDMPSGASALGSSG